MEKNGLPQSQKAAGVKEADKVQTTKAGFVKTASDELFDKVVDLHGIKPANKEYKDDNTTRS